MAAKPIVGINLECECGHRSCAGFSDLLLPRWLDCIGQAGGIPLAVPPLRDESDLNCVLDGLQAFIYAGCQDLGPHYSDVGPEMGESNSDVLLLRSIAEKRVPFLGIGTGIQLLNVALGGTLRSLGGRDQELPRHTHPHNPRHCLKTERGSFLSTVCPDDHTPVSSLHNFAVEHVAVGFSVTATSHEGSIEAIESDSAEWLAVGIQCVPQSDTANLDLRIFRAFLQRVASREPQFV